MRKLATTTVLSSLVAAGSVSQAAPASLNCPDESARNCFRDEIFVLDGNQSVTVDGQSVPLVGCNASTDCYLTKPAELFSSTGLSAAVARAFELIVAGSPNLPGWDEVVVFTADFGPAKQPGPLFFRAQNQDGTPVNRVRNIGLQDVADPDPAKPFLGIIDGGNVKGFGATPATSAYSPCGKLPRRPIDTPQPGSEQAAGAICAPGVYSYFDALAQATAALYGPHLVGTTQEVPLVVLPTVKPALVTAAGVSKFPTSGLSLDVWNALLDTGGSLLGGNTWRNDGNGAFEVARPTAYFGVFPTLDGGVVGPADPRQTLRFQPIDLYLMGFAPSSEVPPLRSFAQATPADVYFPASLAAFSTVVGPGMGTRVGGVIIRAKSGLPASISFADIVAANGGERDPGVDSAPQHIRQLWILVTKPDALRDQVAKDAYDAAVKANPASPPDQQKTIDDSVAAQKKEQDTEITNLQKFRRAYNQYFYLLAEYRGRVVTTFEGNVDDNAYWEFADPADDSKVLVGNGLTIEMKGVQTIPNRGGAKQSVLTVTSTPGSDGTIAYQASSTLPAIRIQGSSKIPAANNLFSVRMRLPADVQLVGRVKAKVVLQGPSGSFESDVPAHPEAFLIPDGEMHTYSVSIAQNYAADASSSPDAAVATSENTAFTGNDYTSFKFTPSNVEVQGIDIEFIRIGNSTDLSDVDKDCGGNYQLDRWIGGEDNCPSLFNPSQADGNGNGVGDACEDYDGDGVLNACDNCPSIANKGQEDVNRNRQGDACDGTREAGGCRASHGPGSPMRSVTLLLGTVALLSLRWLRLRRGKPLTDPPKAS